MQAEEAAMYISEKKMNGQKCTVQVTKVVDNVVATDEQDKSAWCMT